MTYQQLKRREYNSKQYKQNRQWILFYQPTCAKCRPRGIISPVQQIDHVIPIGQWYANREDDKFDPDCSALSNLQGLCKPCHKEKSKEELLAYYKSRNAHKPRFDVTGRIIDEATESNSAL